MPRLTQACLENIRQRVSLVEVAGQYTALKRAGNQFRGLSPFQPEKSPSFYVHPEKNVFTDYSSGHSGGLFRFVQLKENFSFIEAAEALANRYHIPLEYEAGGASREQVSTRAEIFRLHDLALAFFAERFWAEDPPGRAIRDYWVNQRDFTAEQAREFGIGLAPAAAGAFFEAVRQQGFSRSALEQCGLFFLRPEDTQLRSVRCRFRGRLMVPIHDIQGRVCGFTARRTDLTPEDDPQREAKYVNSPETPIFTKGRLLFNLHRARQHLREDTPALLVEGQLDSLRCFSAGLTTVVAPQGTALTPEQLQILSRYTRSLEVFLDGDRAGRDAAFRHLPKILAAGFDVSFLPLPDGTDPDDLIRREGAGAVEKLRRSAVGGMQLAVSHLMPEGTAVAPQRRAALLEQVYAMIGEVESSFVRGQYLGELARLIHAGESEIRRDAEAFWARRQRGRPETAEPPTAKTRPGDAPELPGNPKSAAQTVPVTGAPASMPATVESSPRPAANSAPKVLSVEEELLLMALSADAVLDELATLLDPTWPDQASPAGRLLAQALIDWQEGLWEGSSAFLEALEDPSLHAYAVSLGQMGTRVLDYRCQGAYLRRSAATEIATMYDVADALTALAKILRKRHRDREVARLTEQYLNLPQNEVEKRREVLLQVKVLRSTEHR